MPNELENSNYAETIEVATETKVETFDLAAELSKPTQQRTFDFSTDNNNIEVDFIETAETATNAEFNTDALKEIIEEKVADNFEATYDSSLLAPAIVDGADAIIQQIFPILYEKSTFSEDERNTIKVLAYKQKNKSETVLSENDLSLMALCAEYEKYCETLPLKETEKKQIIKPLSELLKDLNLQTSPTNAFIIAIGLVMLPRILPLITNKFLTKKEEK